MQHKITIGVCAKNSQNTVKECIDSIANQNYPIELMQVIFVDGCSRDETMSIVNSATALSGMIVEICSDNGNGLGAARQIVVNKATGKYIVFIDADVRVLHDFSEKHMNFMEQNLRVGVAFGKPMYQEGTKLFSMIWNLYLYATGGFLGNDATVYRVETLREVGGFDPNIRGAGEDKELIDRIKANGWLVSVNERARFFHNGKDKLTDYWRERSWFGYGDHYIFHKKSPYQLWRALPIGALSQGLKMALKAFRLTHKKISFLIPVHLVLGNVFWWCGLIKGHMDGYGHVR